MHREPTITDVAQHAGVSKGLVSLTLNNRPGVAAETRRRIFASVDALGWTPSTSARGLSMRSTFALGLVVRRSADVLAADPFFPAFIAGVESVLSDVGWSLMLSVPFDARDEERTYRQLGGRRVDGFFLTDLRVDDPRPSLLAEREVAAVMIGRPFTDPRFPAVSQDDRAGVRAAVEHLVGLGHTHIAYVAGDQQLVHGRQRLDAFVAAVTTAGLSDDHVIGEFSAASGARATADLLTRRDRPTAVVYGSDPMAIAGLGVLQAAGIAVPATMSVVGFDGNELGAYLHPALTTVLTDPLRWGAEAARTLLRVIELRPSDPRALDYDLRPAELLLRASTAPPPP
ncbi:MAG: LacI family DNA-binding transcriptional regulator [Propionibacteriaceae bacterium]